MTFKMPSIKMPWGKRSAGKTRQVKLPPVMVPPVGVPPVGVQPVGVPQVTAPVPVSTDKIPPGKISWRMFLTGKIRSVMISTAVPVSMRPVSLGLLMLAATGLLASLVVTVWPKVLWGWPVIDADTAFALMRLLPLATAFFGVLAGVLCLAFVRAPAASGDQLPADPPATPVVGDALADSGLQDVVRELQTILAGEQAKASAFEELCNANGREARTMAAHVTRLSEASRDAEGRLASAVERATAVLRQPPQGDVPAAIAGPRPERAPMDMSDVILRRITEQTRVIGMTLDGAVGRMAAETESSVHSFRAAVIDATVHITALGETAVGLRRDVIALDTAGREIATAGATVISRVGGAVANVDAALSYLPAAVAAVTGAAEQAGQTLAEAAAVLCADSAAIEACARETRQTAEMLQREASALDTARQEIAGAGAAAGQAVEAAAARLAAVIAGADSARQGPSALADITTALEQVAATLANGAANAVEAASGLRADAAASGHEMRQAAEMMQQGASALGTARQEIAGAGLTAGRTLEAAAARLAAVIADAESPRQGPAALTEITSALEQVAATLADGAANTADAAAVLRADAAASGHEMRTAAKLVQREAAALGTARQEIIGAGASAGRTVEAAAAKLAADLRQGSAGLAATLEAASATLATAALDVKSATDGLCSDSAASSHGTRQAAESVQREASALAAARQDIADAGALAARNVDDATARLASVIADAERAGEGSTLAFETAVARLADAASGVAEASGTLSADGAVFGHDIRQAVELLQREAASGAVGHDKLASVTQALVTAAAQLTAVIEDASGPDLMGTLEAATATLLDASASLDSAGQRVAEAGDRVTDRIAAGIASSQAAMAALPDVRAELTSATVDLRLETLDLTAAAKQISAAGTAATSAVTEAAIRAETATTLLADAGRAMNVSNAEATLQIDRLSGVSGQVETQISLLPAVVAEIGAAAGRLRDMTEVDDALRSILPDAAARLEAAAPGLDRLEALGLRLESTVDGLPAAPAREASMMTQISLSADICAAVLRVEAALSAHDGVWPAVAASMAQVEAAAAALAQATAELTPIPAPERAVPGGTPAALTATLRQLDDVTAQTETLLRQTEALAEAVAAGHAPGLAVLLADRTPELLAGIDSMTRRMRSVATALALVNDGIPSMERRAG